MFYSNLQMEIPRIGELCYSELWVNEDVKKILLNRVQKVNDLPNIRKIISGNVRDFCNSWIIVYTELLTVTFQSIGPLGRCFL